jgi:hypothetical protein
VLLVGVSSCCVRIQRALVNDAPALIVSPISTEAVVAQPVVYANTVSRITQMLKHLHLQCKMHKNALKCFFLSLQDAQNSLQV